MKKVLGLIAVIVSGAALYWFKKPATLPEFSVSNIPQEKHLVVFIPSYNNKDWCERNLASLFTQKHPDGRPYKNWHLYLVDDASTDGQYEIITSYIKQKQMQDHCIVIRKEKNVGSPLPHLIEVADLVHDDQAIIVCVDGDDWVAHDYVFAKINEIYQNQEVWITYGQHLCWPQYTIGGSVPLPRLINYKGFRKYEFFTSHIRTFYVWLFKKIKHESLKMDGDWIHICPDVPLMWPMLEMAGPEHIQFVPYIMYIYNTAYNTLARKKTAAQKEAMIQKQKQIMQYLKAQKPYERLSKPS